jgi:hypothetical protein
MLSTFTLFKAWGQSYNFPEIGSQTEPNLKIAKVIIDENSTKIDFVYTRSQEKGIYIYLNYPKSTNAYFIKANDKIYNLISTEGIGNSNRITPAYPNAPVYFSAIFEAIPKQTKSFDLIEGQTGHWNFYDIKLKMVDEGAQESNCNEIKFSPKSTNSDFSNYLIGVRNAVVIWDPKVNKYSPIQDALFRYLKNMGFENIIEKSDWEKHVELLGNNLCETVYIDIDFAYNGITNQAKTIHYDEDYIDNISINFLSCNNDFWSFKSDQKVNARSNDNLEIGMYNAFVNAYNKTKGGFNIDYILKQDRHQTCWSEVSLKEAYSKGLNLEIEGIYENTSNLGSRYRLALKYIKGNIYLIYLSGSILNKDNWKEGEIKAELEPTSTQAFYKVKWYNADKSLSDDYYINFENGLFTLVNNDTKESYIKMYPYFDKSKSKVYSTSGTGFAISAKGYIVTNYHVTQSSKEIKIRGINGNFAKAYNGTIVVEDKNNDLAIIKVDDPTFASLDVIPFTIASRTSEVGTSIFALGYPLLTVMGDEVKLTNGIISAKSGFQGDITTYQITAPIQPGNSGGPLFDNKGNLIGIVNAKLKGAENASYAIKSSYLLSLINLLDHSLKLQSKNLLEKRPFTEQVKIIKNFTYIIEVN